MKIGLMICAGIGTIELGYADEKRTREDVHSGYAKREVSVRGKLNRFPAGSNTTDVRSSRRISYI